MPVQQAVYEPLLPLPDVTADGAWSPQADLRELPDEYIVLADLPGVEPEAVHVTSEKDTLTITGARRDRLRAGGVPYRLERPAGKLRRSIPLPGPYDRTKITTQIRDGVLEIRVPKEASRSRSTEFRATHADVTGGVAGLNEAAEATRTRKANYKSSRSQQAHGLQSVVMPGAESSALTR